jgi:hypothetical protein
MATIPILAAMTPQKRAPTATTPTTKIQIKNTEEKPPETHTTHKHNYSNRKQKRKRKSPGKQKVDGQSEKNRETKQSTTKQTDKNTQISPGNRA